MFGENEIAMRIEAFVALIVCFLSTCDRRDPQTQMDSPDTNQSNDGGIFLSWRHPVSHRTAILEEIDGMVWLYLSLPQTTEPARDCPAFVTDTPPDSVDWERIKQTGESPGITKDIATERALIEHPSPEDFSAVWSSDGGSVALRHRGELICMIVAGHKRGHSGHSKAVAGSSPLGEPFDDSLFASTFTTSPQP